MCRVFLILLLSFAEQLEAEPSIRKSTKNSGATNKPKRQKAKSSQVNNSAPTAAVPRPTSSPVSSERVNQSIAVKSEEIGNLSAKDLYLRARDFFASGNYAQAIQYSSAALTKSPNANLPVVLMAQSYYRMGNASKAGSLFRSVEFDNIGSEAAVDYALTMFSIRRYRDVIKIYRFVPEGHPYRDVVRFYVGVSYMNFKQYAYALKYIRPVGNLPANLKAQRRRLLSELDDIRDLERGEKNGSQSQQFGYREPMLQYIPPPAAPRAPTQILPGGTPGDKAAVKAAPPASPAKSSMTVSAAPSIGFSADTGSYDYNGVSQSRFESKSPTAEISLGLKILGNARSFGGQPSLDVYFTPSYSHTDTKSTSSSLTASVDDPSNVQNNISNGEVATFGLKKKYGITGLYPVAETVDVGAGVNVVNKHSVTAAETGDTRTDSTTTTPVVNFGVEVADFQVDGKWSQDQETELATHDNDRSKTTLKLGVRHSGDAATTSGSISSSENSKPLIDGGIKSSLTFSASFVRDFEDFSLNLAGSKSDKIREPGKAAGTILNQYTVSATGSYALPFGLSFDVLGGYAGLSNLVIQNAAVDGVVPESMASGTAKELKVTVKASMSSFLTFTGSYGYITRALQISDTTFEKKLQSSQWSRSSSTSLSVTASTSF